VTRVDFYVLENGAGARERFACRLAEKVFRLGHRVLVHPQSPDHAKRLDDLLWTWRDGSFVPHLAWSGDLDPADVEATPVIVGDGGDPPVEADVLINLADDVPSAFSRFERVAEIVDADPEVRSRSRARFAFYRDRGYPLDTHRI
jgi:DNA polymerase-3 subunit chi